VLATSQATRDNGVVAHILPDPPGVITIEPADIAKLAADAARMGGRVFLKVLLGTSALTFEIRGDGTVIPPGGYEAVTGDGMLTGARAAE
jgi:hypothetical protein